MALDRKDVRAKLDPELHAKLVEICDLDGIDISEAVEAVISEAVLKRCADAIELANRLARRGISGISRESPPDSGKPR